jgi:hypothetical protein
VVSVFHISVRAFSGIPNPEVHPTSLRRWRAIIVALVTPRVEAWRTCCSFCGLLGRQPGLCS